MGRMMRWYWLAVQCAAIVAGTLGGWRLFKLITG